MTSLVDRPFNFKVGILLLFLTLFRLFTAYCVGVITAHGISVLQRESYFQTEYWRVRLPLSLEPRLFRHFSLRFLFIFEVMVSFYSFSFLLDPVCRRFAGFSFFS